jgi:S-adenosyl methyltransferase
LYADRKAAAEVAACRPEVVAGARANRAFLARAVRYLASQQGVRQFIDIGPGLPAPGNTHDIAHGGTAGNTPGWELLKEHHATAPEGAP